ncbi:unnamed protein product [Adineta ricciae]|uniref:NHL repeat containing protein n=1 Tax=Adineta ricciae TaxID=249248 RepID=A0A815J5E0_ADIRI|nr:unnamed protein product [Adineta ricciae]
MILYKGIDGNLRWNTTGETVFKSRNITSGSRGIYIDFDDTMYIADMDVVWKLLPNRTMVTVVAGTLNSTGPNSTQLSYPQDVYVDRYGNIYVTDYYNNRVQKFINNSAVGITIAGNGTSGTGLHQLYNPTFFAFDSTNTYFYVVDYGNNRVLKFPSNSTSGGNGTLVAGVNNSSNQNTSFDQPSGIALSPSLIDNLFITLYGEHSVIRWTSNTFSGIFVAGISDVPGSNSTLLRNPRGIRIDHNLNIFVADAGNHRIQMFCAGSQTGITVADSNNRRIQRFLKI